MKIKPPVLVGVFLLMAILLHYFLPVARIIYAPYNLTGFVFIFAGIFLMSWTIKLFRKNGTTYRVHEKPRVLVTEGPLRFSRNPIYLGFTLILLGAAVYLGTITSFAAPILFILTINATVIQLEEKKLEAIFGKQYLDYKKRVRRWM